MKNNKRHPEVWRRRRDSQGSALRSLREQPIMFGFAEWSSSLSYYFFGEGVSLFPSCGAQRNLRAARLLDFFDHCAISPSLHRPPDAVRLVPVNAATRLLIRVWRWFGQNIERQNKKTSVWMSFRFGSPCWARTSDNAVNSRVLCQLS